MLDAAHVAALNIAGGPGCGKTALLAATLTRLAPDVRAAAIVCSPFGRRDADRLTSLAREVVALEVGEAQRLDARRLHEALGRLRLDELGLVLIENVSSMSAPFRLDLGESARVCVLSVAAGDDKPEKFPHLVRGADAVVLNKTDLLGSVRFDIERFRDTVGGLNPAAKRFEVSVLQDRGMEPWLEWVRSRLAPEKERPCGWFG